MNFKDACALVIFLAHIINGIVFVAFCAPKLLIYGGKGSNQDLIGCCTISGYALIAFVFSLVFEVFAICWRKFSWIEVQIKPDGDQENPLQEIVISPLTRIRRAIHL